MRERERGRADAWLCWLYRRGFGLVVSGSLCVRLNRRVRTFSQLRRSICCIEEKIVIASLPLRAARVRVWVRVGVGGPLRKRAFYLRKL